ncbi:hypothetical protein Tco_0808385 [Tanacetum coccineum]
MAEEEEQEREGDPEDTNTIAYIEERRDTPLLERKDITDVGNLGSNKDGEGIEWLDVEEPLDLVDTSEESVYELLIKEMPKCLLNYDFRIKKDDSRNLKIPCMIGLGRDMHVFVGNMSYVIDFTILENIETNIDPSLSHEAFDLEDGFYRDTINLGPEYATGMDDEGEVTTWMAFGRNTRNLGSFGEETDKITDLHQIHKEILFTERGDGVAGIKRRRRDLSSDSVRDLATASGRG